MAFTQMDQKKSLSSPLLVVRFPCQAWRHTSPTQPAEALQVIKDDQNFTEREWSTMKYKIPMLDIVQAQKQRAKGVYSICSLTSM